MILSITEVKMIGWLAVPSAMIFAPLEMISADAKEPVPVLPLMMVPGCIVSVALFSTTTFPANSYMLFEFQVVLLVMLPDTTTLSVVVFAS